MSVTFMPSGNIAYCDKHKLTTQTSYTCQCVDYPNHVHQPCRDCGGTGEVHFTNYPFELNVANDNAHALLEMLGIKPDYCGEAEPQKILDGIEFIRSLRNSGVTPLETETRVDGGDGRVRMVACGRSAEQVAGYLDRMERVAMEAARRHVSVVWA